MRKTTLFTAITLVFSIFWMTACQDGVKDGYTETESGLLYKIHVKGDGTVSPVEGTFLDVIMTYGTGDSVLFDSRTLPQQQQMQIPMIASVYQGDIYEGFALLHEGDSVTFMLNADSVWTKLFRMPKAPPGMDSIEYLFFDIKLNGISTREEMEAKKDAEMAALREEETDIRNAFIKKNYPDVQPTESGIYYIRVKKGSGNKPVKGQTVKVHYTGTSIDGEKFDSSLDRGIPIDFVLGTNSVIAGWEEGISMMQKGEKATFIIPSDLAYGDRGSGARIPPFSTLIFEVELVDIVDKK